MKKLLLLLAAIFILTSCATVQSLDSSVRTYTYERDYNSVLKAIVTYCNEKAFPITSVDKELGIINTDYKENEGTAKFLFGNSRAKMNFSITKQQESKTKVLLNLSIEKQGAFGSWSQATMTEGQAADYYKTVFKNIGGYLQ